MLDKTDGIILRELLQNSRYNFTEIAGKTGKTKKTIWQHYNKMKRSGVIIGSTLQLNYRKLGFRTVVNIFGSIENQTLPKALEQVQKMPNIYSVFPATPEYNLGICALLKDIRELDSLRNKLRLEINIQKMKTFSWLAVKNFPENLLFHPELEKNKPSKKAEVKNLEKKFKFNPTDKKIIEALGANSRIAFSTLSKEIRVSQNKITKRYKKLIERNIIKSVIQINPCIIGYKAFISFSLSFSSKIKKEEAINYLINLPDVIHIIITSGDFEFIVYAFVRTMEQFHEIKQKIANIPELINMNIEIYPQIPIWPTPNQYISTF